jgi:hypothetical protein
MIYLGHQPTLIELGAGAVALDEHWLQQCLEEAAITAGYPEWPAADVARTVTAFLYSKRTALPFSFEGFTAAVRVVLHDLGYKEVAPHFLQNGIEVRYSLLDVAEELPAGFELGLFKACADLCKRLLSSGLVTTIRLENLKPAVKKTLAKTHWCPTCQKLAGELVVFLRETLFKISAEGRLTFSIR